MTTLRRLVPWFGAAISLAPVASADVTFDPKHGSFCGPNIDWVNELASDGQDSDGHWWHDPTAKRFGPPGTANPFLVAKRPTLTYAVPKNMTSPYLESADLFYKRLDFPGGIINDFHASLFTEVIFTGSGVGPLTFVGRSREGLASFWNATTGFAYATENRDKSISELPVNLFASTADLINRFQELNWRYAQKSGTADGEFWRGGRTVASGVTSAQRRKIHQVGADLVRAPIGYIFDDMLDQKNRLLTWGWEGTVSDIDDIRCDGLVEFAYEESGVRLWGGDTWWNLGSRSDDNYNRHNNSWDGMFHDYEDSEVSPMVQSACGGFGTGINSRAKSRDRKLSPTIEWFAGDAVSSAVTRITRRVIERESDWIYEVAQVQDSPSGEWRTIYDPAATVGLGRGWGRTQLLMEGPREGRADDGFDWSGHYKTATATGHMSPDAAFKFRYVVVDQGGNVAVTEHTPRGFLAHREVHTSEFQAFNTGIQQYWLHPPEGADFDVVISDSETGELLAYGNLSGSSVENPYFFVQENQRYKIEISSYSGQGRYLFGGTPPVPATRYRMDQLHNTNESNGWQVSFNNLPNAWGWGITWSRSGSSRALDLSGQSATGQTFPSSGAGSTRFITTNYAPLSNLTVSDPTGGAQFANKDEAKNVFFLWQVH